MDLDWLHAVIEGRCRFGRTFAMLVIAVQQADFVSGDLVIIGKHPDHVENLKDMFAKAAEELEFTVAWERPDRARIKNATYHFRSATSLPESFMIPKAVFFYDHYVPLLEHVVQTACMGYEIDFMDIVLEPKPKRHRGDPMSYESGWCETCNCPIGVGSCNGCIAYSSVLPEASDMSDFAYTDPEDLEE